MSNDERSPNTTARVPQQNSRPTPPTARDERPPTSRDQRQPTARDAHPATARDERADAPADPVPASAIRLPDYLERDYQFEKELDSGAESDVALISHRHTGQLKVVKIYRRGITLPQSFVEKLSTADPRHVLPVTRTTYTGWANPRFIELMDYLPEGSLETLLRDRGGSAPAIARDILIELTDALEYIHDQLQIVHRDIKPANILIRSPDPLDLVLADLGIAAELDAIRRSRRETTGGVKGTLAYQAPETLNTPNAGQSRDWWALGMTLCEVLTGQHPFKDGRGNTLHDENMIRHAITMGAIDLSMIRDERWNLLCRGLLVHNPADRWAAPQIRAWLAGESPNVAATHAQAPPHHVTRPYRFAGQRFTDPVELATHMTTHWGQAADVFTSAEGCETLRTWIREELNDPTIDVNTLTPISGGDQSQIDARIIEFSTHYRDDTDIVFRGVPISADDLAARYLNMGDRWAQDPLLSALTPTVAAALAEAHLDENAGPDDQSHQYYALARLARYADDVDARISSMRSRIWAGASNSIEGTDVGTDVRDALPARTARAQALARAALLSPACLNGIRDELHTVSADHPPWFAELCAAAQPWHAAQAVVDQRMDVDAYEVAATSLAVTVADLAAIYSRAAATAVAESRRRRAEFEAQQREEAIQRRARVRLSRDRRFIVWAIGLCVTVAVPLGLGYFVMSKTSLLKPDPAVWTDDVRKFSDEFPAYYLAGLVPILLLLAAVLLWPPLQRRTSSILIGVAALVATIVVASHAHSSWNEAENKAAVRLTSTIYPFEKHYYTCGYVYFDLSWKYGGHEMWQAHLAQTRGFNGTGCNRICIYKGWTQVGVFTLDDGDTFLPDTWDNTDTSRGGFTLADIFVNIKTVQGHTLRFSLDGAQHNDFSLT